MRLVVASLVLLTLVEPAPACHRLSRWNYPWPQRCSVKPVSPPATVAKEPEFPRPDLTPTGGGDADEDMRARLLLPATLEKGKN
jgi:hypothetical protein